MLSRLVAARPGRERRVDPLARAGVLQEWRGPARHFARARPVPRDWRVDVWRRAPGKKPDCLYTNRPANEPA